MVLICFVCPLSMYFRFFPLYHVSFHILLNREIHSQAVLDPYKYIVWGSMKRDCPSLIRDKTQHPFHFFFFFIGHAFMVAFYIYTSYGLFSFTIMGYMSDLSAIVAFRWRTSGGGFIHVHCVFISHLDCDCFCFWLRRSGCCVRWSDLLFEHEFFSSEEFRRFSEGSFQFCGTIVPFLKFSGCCSISRIPGFNYPSS